MKISLVICTRNRASQLAESLNRVRSLRCPNPWELILVDNGGNDDARAVIEEYRQCHVGEISVIAEPLPGLGRARNRGWKASRGEIVAFTDDDCLPDGQFLLELIDCFAEDSRLGFVGGRILLYDPTDFPITIQESQQRQDLPPGSFIPAGLIQGANFACRRTALEAVGGFDETFGAGALFPCEDVDVIARISDAGWFGAYDPRPVIFHHHGRRTIGEATRLMKEYDRGRGAYFAKCLLNPSQRALYFKNWWWRIRSQALGTTFREFRAALEYFVRVCFLSSTSKNKDLSSRGCVTGNYQESDGSCHRY